MTRGRGNAKSRRNERRNAERRARNQARRGPAVLPLPDYVKALTDTAPHASGGAVDA